MRLILSINSSPQAEDKLDSGLEKSIKEHYGETLKGAWDLVQKEVSKHEKTVKYL